MRNKHPVPFYYYWVASKFWLLAADKQIVMVKILPRTKRFASNNQNLTQNTTQNHNHKKRVEIL